MRLFFLIAIALGLIVSLGGNSLSADGVLTADPNASQQTQNVLIYLQNVSRRSTHRVVTGQYFGSAQCCGPSEYAAAGWAASIAALAAATGQTPGIIGADYNDYNSQNPGHPVNYETLNAYLVSAWQAGSLVMVSYHANNPWTGRAWNDTSCGSGGTLADLVNPLTAVYAAWRAQIGIIATQLQYLQNQGVVVIWRPFLEQNSSPWWWMSCNKNMSQLGMVWADMFKTFTTTYKLHNLLWAYSSNGPWLNVNGCPGKQGEDGICLYPGSDYVDIVGFDDYSDKTGPNPDPFPGNWRAWTALGKVVGFTERGPHEISGASQVFTTLIPDIIANRGSSVPVGAFFVAYGGGYSISSNPGASALMNDPNAANQKDVARALSCMNSATTFAGRVACVLK